jgi:hypothetical protein
MALDEVAASEAILDLIVVNSGMITAGITHQGQPRDITQVTDSPLTPAADYYYVLVNITNSSISSQKPATNVARPMSLSRYFVQIEIADTAWIEVSDLTLEAYMTSHRDFRTVGDRIVNLIHEQDEIGTSPKFRLERTTGSADRRIEKRDLSGVFQDTEQNDVAILYATLNFTLVSC